MMTFAGNGVQTDAFGGDSGGKKRRNKKKKRTGAHDDGDTAGGFVAPEVGKIGDEELGGSGAGRGDVLCTALQRLTSFDERYRSLVAGVTRQSVGIINKATCAIRGRIGKKLRG